MPAISANKAVQRLAVEVENMRPNDLVEFYYELFPIVSKAEDTSTGEGGRLRREILDRLRQGLEIEEILDLWNVAFPEAYGVHYDDEGDVICYQEGPTLRQMTDSVLHAQKI